MKQTYKIAGVDGFSAYEVALDAAAEAANRGNEGEATAEKILDVIAEFSPEVPVTQKQAARAADKYNRAVQKVVDSYSE